MYVYVTHTGIVARDNEAYDTIRFNRQRQVRMGIPNPTAIEVQPCGAYGIITAKKGNKQVQ